MGEFPVFKAFYQSVGTSLVAQMVKRLPTMQETRVQSLGWEDLLEKEMATHSSILAWKIPWTVEPGRLHSMGSQRVGHDWATSLSLHIQMKFDLFLWFTLQVLSQSCHLSLLLPNILNFYIVEFISLSYLVSGFYIKDYKNFFPITFLWYLYYFFVHLSLYFIWEFILTLMWELDTILLFPNCYLTSK